MRPLFADRFSNTGEIPFLELGHLPTGIEHLKNLGERINVPSLYVKRDDRSGPLYGGNKVRKLEFLLADAIENNCEDVWTVGGVGSHHALCTAIYARDAGLNPRIIHFPQPVTSHVLDTLRALSTTEPTLELKSSKVGVALKIGQIKIRNNVPGFPQNYYIPPGGSSPVGVLGFVNAAFELEDQVKQEEIPEPDYIFVAVGSGGSVSGLTLGLSLTDLDTEVVGVRVIDRYLVNSFLVCRLTNQTSRFLSSITGTKLPFFTMDDFNILGEYFGEAYGEPTPGARDAKRIAAESEEINLDLTYTAKALAGIIGERERLDLASATVLFWHTFNGIDISDRIEQADLARDLPVEYQKFFNGGY